MNKLFVLVVLPSVCMLYVPRGCLFGSVFLSGQVEVGGREESVSHACVCTLFMRHPLYVPCFTGAGRRAHARERGLLCCYIFLPLVTKMRCGRISLRYYRVEEMRVNVRTEAFFAFPLYTPTTLVVLPRDNIVPLILYFSFDFPPEAVAAPSREHTLGVCVEVHSRGIHNDVVCQWLALSCVEGVGGCIQSSRGRFFHDNGSRGGRQG